jgi:hypothetical protein
MSTVSRQRASFGTAKREIPGVLLRALAMYDGFMNNVGSFSSPTITMVAFLALITALQTAQQAVKGTNAKGAAALRDTKRDALWTAMESLRTYVQGLADVLSAQAAASLIQSAGLVVWEVGTHEKAIISAALTTTLGTVHLEANASLLVGPADAAKKCMFNWQVSTNGTTWTDLHGTPLASTDVTGLTPMTNYMFRVSVTIGTVTGAWSQPVGLLVH